jgi:SAM-dependent methyltransferase
LADREELRRLARESIARGDATGWFEEAYRRTGGDWQRVSWVDLVPNRFLVEWLNGGSEAADGRTCLVVGCGLGDDAEALASAGYAVTAFDIAPTAVEGCHARFPRSRVTYVTADLLHPPAEWASRFDLVVESYTLQVLPPEARRMATKQLAQLLRPGGELLILCRGRDPGDPAGELPWPLTRSEFEMLRGHGLREGSFEDFLDGETPPVRRFRISYRRDEKGGRDEGS